MTYLKYFTIACLFKNCYLADKSHFPVPDWHLFSVLYCSNVNVTLRPTVLSPHENKAHTPSAAEHCHLSKCLAWLISVKSDFYKDLKMPGKFGALKISALSYHICYETGTLSHLTLGAYYAGRVLESGVSPELVAICSMRSLGGAWGAINWVLKQTPSFGSPGSLCCRCLR